MTCTIRALLNGQDAILVLHSAQNVAAVIFDRNDSKTLACLNQIANATFDIAPLQRA